MAVIGTLRVETAAPVSGSEAVEKVSSVVIERQAQQSCTALIAIIGTAGDYSGLSLQCKNAIANSGIQKAICSTACDDLYQAEAQCYGSAAAQAAHSSVCTTSSQTCTTFIAIILNNYSGLSQRCTNAIQISGTNYIQGAICTSACSDLYEAEAQCYGAAATQAAYKTFCTNGYQGEAARQATAHYVVVGAALVAAATAVLHLVVHNL
ncbi:hypothetical protein EMCRGX_G002005 [Ephydatia muelleri]